MADQSAGRVVSPFEGVRGRINCGRLGDRTAGIIVVVGDAGSRIGQRSQLARIVAAGARLIVGGL